MAGSFTLLVDCINFEIPPASPRLRALEP